MNSGAEKTKRFFQHPAVYWAYLCIGGFVTVDAVYDFAIRQDLDGVTYIGLGMLCLSWGFEGKQSASGGKRPWVSALVVIAGLLIFGPLALRRFG